MAGARVKSPKNDPRGPPLKDEGRRNAAPGPHPTNSSMSPSSIGPVVGLVHESAAVSPYARFVPVHHRLTPFLPLVRRQCGVGLTQRLHALEAQCGTGGLGLLKGRLDRRQFDELVEKGELLEWAEVFDNYYGTPKKPVLDALAAGRDVLFDIDWQGTQQLRESARSDMASIFVLPPSIPELARRLHTRAEDDYETIHRRMAKVADELSHWSEYDYVVINDDLETAYSEVKTILTAERLKRERQPGLPDFIRSLQSKL